MSDGPRVWLHHDIDRRYIGATEIEQVVNVLATNSNEDLTVYQDTKTEVEITTCVDPKTGMVTFLY